MGNAIRFAASEEALHEQAIERAGSDDFGDSWYKEGLRRVLDAYDTEARFTDRGRALAWHGLVDILSKRLRAEALLKQHAASLAREIRRPLIITGLVRTGSTALHHLVGHDPAVQVVEYWLACQPQPRPPRDTWAGHPDFKAAETELELMYRADPSLKAIHMMMADGPEECRHFLAQSFTDDYFEVNSTIPSYVEWYEKADLCATYHRHRDLLRLVSAPTPEKPWVLKYPVHMKNLQALLEVYPDACIVWTHRDPSRVMSSYISLVAGFRAFYEAPIDRDAIAREQLEVWTAGVDAAIEVRRQLDETRFFDLQFRDFVSDPIASVRRIYEYFGLPFTEKSEHSLRQWHDANPKEKHGEHRHSMDDVGLSRQEVLARFAHYMDYFGMEPE